MCVPAPASPSRGDRLLIDGGSPMCDYSLQHLASRPAKVGDRLVSTKFTNSVTRGFTAVGDPQVAVCLLPGTELAFDEDVKYDGLFWIPRRKKDHVARFRRLDEDQQASHHDALEFPSGETVLVTRLRPDQHATVLQLPAHERLARAEPTSEDVFTTVPRKHPAL
jgi:hypothetical protein